MRLGVCYYPELWPRERWQADAKLMRDSGIEFVRLGEFAWGSYERSRNEFTWDWLDEAIDTLGSAGIRVVMATPTAAPPLWLSHQRPEVLAVDATGRRLPDGGPRITCPTSPAYRLESARVVDALVTRYGSHEAIEAWQLDDDPGGLDSARCWCHDCHAAFASWLQARFIQIDDLNTAWATGFWSHVYPSFDAVRLPVPGRTPASPSLLLAHRRFASGQVLSGLAPQAEIVRRNAVGRDIVISSDLSANEVDWGRAGHLAEVFVHRLPRAPRSTADSDGGSVESAFAHDLCRSVAAKRAWAIDAPRSRGPEQQLRIAAWQAHLHGIEALFFSNWRPSPSAHCRSRGSLVGGDGSPTRALNDVERVSRELSAARARTAANPSRRAALLCTVEDAWAIDTETDPHAIAHAYAADHAHRDPVSHRALVLAAYEALLRVHYAVDVVHAGHDLDGYSLIVAPALHLVTAASGDALRGAAQAGHTVVIGPRSLARTVENCWIDGPTPGGGLAQRCGVTVSDEGHEARRVTVTIGHGELAPVEAGPWIAVYENGAAASNTRPVVLARYSGPDDVNGLPAAVRAGPFVFAGFSSADAWTALLRLLTGCEDPLPRHREKFGHGNAAVIIDHKSLTISGVPDLAPAP
jgi:beta-galactosidase